MPTAPSPLKLPHRQRGSLRGTLHNALLRPYDHATDRKGSVDRLHRAGASSCLPNDVIVGFSSPRHLTLRKRETKAKGAGSKERRQVAELDYFVITWCSMRYLCRDESSLRGFVCINPRQKDGDGICEDCPGQVTAAPSRTCSDGTT